jgi:DNA-binding beta-propeller fold protein YncE
VRKFDADGNLLADVGEGTLTDPRAVAIGPAGAIYVADTGGEQLVRFAAGVPPATVGPGTIDDAFAFEPSGVAVTPGGDAFAVELGNTIVRHFDAGGFVERWGGLRSLARAVVQNPGFHIGPERADLVSMQIDQREHAALGAVLETHSITVNAVRLDHPKLTSGGSISDHYLGRGVDIAAIDGEPVSASNPTAREVAVALGELPPAYRPDSIGSPFAIAGPGYFTDAAHQDHIHIGYDSSVHPRFAAAGPDGSLYVADPLGGDVARFDATGRLLAEWPAGTPGGIGTDPAGNVYVTDAVAGLVRKFAANGDLLAVLSGGLSAPSGVAAGAGGSVFVLDSGNARVVRFDALP